MRFNIKEAMHMELWSNAVFKHIYELWYIGLKKTIVLTGLEIFIAYLEL